MLPGAMRGSGESARNRRQRPNARNKQIRTSDRWLGIFGSQPDNFIYFRENRSLPITPFHFGPGALIKCVAPGLVSWTVFALANVLIDLEPIALFLLTGEPAHPWLHTLPGAILVAIVAATAGRQLCEWFLRWWNRQLSPAQARWFAVPAQIGRAAAWAGAFLGTVSHILLDAVMHVDVRPFWPLYPGNPMQGWIAIERLQWGCVAAGVLGIAVLAIVKRHG